jgi:hypothetical protein
MKGIARPNSSNWRTSYTTEPIAFLFDLYNMIAIGGIVTTAISGSCRSWRVIRRDRPLEKAQISIG